MRRQRLPHKTAYRSTTGPHRTSTPQRLVSWRPSPPAMCVSLACLCRVVIRVSCSSERSNPTSPIVSEHCIAARFGEILPKPATSQDFGLSSAAYFPGVLMPSNARRFHFFWGPSSPCPLCKCPLGVTSVEQVDDFRFFRCGNCDEVFTMPRTTARAAVTDPRSRTSRLEAAAAAADGQPGSSSQRRVCPRR